MATLTEISIAARKTIRYGIYIIILIVIIRYSLGLGRNIYNRLFPPPPEPPSVGFDVLPALPLPQETTEGLSFELETTTGELPSLTNKLPVYFMPPIVSGLSDLDDAKEKADGLGFDPDGKKVVDNVPNVYVFKKGQESTLTMDIIKGTFSISYDLSSNPSVIGGNPPPPSSAISAARGYLSSANSLAPDLSETAVHQLIRITQGNYEEAISLSEADLIRVNIFRKDYAETLPAVTPNMPLANIWFLLSSGREIIAAEYKYYPVNEERFETYPIISAQEAWEKLTGGQAHVANLGVNENEITIRRVYLAYYDAGQYTQFYQPVVVFEGDNNFFAYVPAVTDEYYVQN